MNSNSTELNKKGFDSLNLIKPICRAVREENYSSPTPIQVQAIPHLLKGRDLIGYAQTGTGKTGAFAWPILQGLSEKRNNLSPNKIHALVLTPTRELAIQIYESFQAYGRHLNIKPAVVFGGVSYKSQINSLEDGVDILVATTGRLIDLLEQGFIQLKQVKFLVLDEADRMLDMGFLPDIKKILTLMPRKRQSMLFSATFPKEILDLTKSVLTDPVSVKVSPGSVAAKNIDQNVMFVDRENKSDLLVHVLQNENITRGLIFVRTRHGANRITKKLIKNDIKVEALHGNQSQAARLKALNKFQSGESPFLVATDIVSRGIDVEGVTHVIIYELPNETESYIHRIGRTARAGASGIAISFCDAGECGYLRKIERTINSGVVVIDSHPFHSSTIASKFKRQKKTTVKSSNSKKVQSKKRLGSGSSPKRTQSKEWPAKSSSPKRTQSKEWPAKSSSPKRTQSKEWPAKNSGPKRTQSKEWPTKSSDPKRTQSKEWPTKSTGPQRTQSKEWPVKSSGPKRTQSKEWPAKSSGPKRTQSKEWLAKSSGPKRTQSKESPVKSTGPKRTQSKEWPAKSSGPKRTQSKKSPTRSTNKSKNQISGGSRFPSKIKKKNDKTKP